MNADNAILGSALVTMVSTSAASILPHQVNRSPRGVDCVAGELPSFRMLIGQTLLYAGLGMLAPVAPKMVGMFSVLIAASAFTYYGSPILQQAFSPEGICKPGETINQTTTGTPRKTKTAAADPVPFPTDAIPGGGHI